MNLTIDRGNTSTKAALFDGERLVESLRMDDDFDGQLQELLRRYDVTACAVSNVAGQEEQLRATLQVVPCEVRYLTWQSPVRSFGLRGVPEGLGADRLAAVLGAMSLSPQQQLLVIDAGTCLTYDYISAAGDYLGGSISPGLELRLRAMYEHTALLPLVSLQGDAPLVGHDTDTALRSGAVHGVCFEIEGFLRADRRRRGDVAAYFAGADALPFSSEARALIVAEPRLVAIGLNRFLNEGA